MPDMMAESDALIAEIKAVKLTSSVRWPKIKIGPYFIVAGKASRFTKQICCLSRTTEIEIRRLKKIHSNFKKDKFEEKNNFYEERITPLEDKLFQLRSFLTLQLRFEFQQLRDKRKIGVGQKGKAFYFNLPGEDPIHPGYGNLLLDDEEPPLEVDIDESTETTEED